MNLTATDWPPYRQRAAALEDVEARLAFDPDDLERRFERAGLLAELGRPDEAKQAYLEIVARWPDHFGR